MRCADPARWAVGGDPVSAGPAKASKARGAVFVLAAMVGLHLLGFGLVLSLIGGVLGGVTANRSLPPKLGDPESWRKFQEQYPDSVKGKGGEGK